MASHISILTPTRGRPDLVKRLMQSLAQHAEHPDNFELVLCIDDDDTKSHSLDCRDFRLTKIIGPRATMGQLNTNCYQQATGDILMLVNDDMVMQTRGWDRRILDVHHSVPDGVYLAYPNDLYEKNRLSTAPILSRKTCETLVYPYPLAYPGGLIDYHILDIFRRLEKAGYPRIHFLEDVILEHRHFSYGKGEHDSTYADRGPIDVGDEVFLGLCQLRRETTQRLIADIEKKPLPSLPSPSTTEDAPAENLAAACYYAKAFLMDFTLPLAWRLHLFEMFNHRYLLKKYKFPTPSWQYRVLKKIAPAFRFPIRILQGLTKLMPLKQK